MHFCACVRSAYLRSVRALIRPTSACRHILLPCSCCINTRTCNSTSGHDSAQPLWPHTFVHELENDASTRVHLLARAHACETICCVVLARKPEVSSLVWPARRASARLRTPLRGTNFESAPSPALFNESMTTCTTLVHSTLGTYMHASFTQCMDPSGPMYTPCAPAARGGRACGAEIFIIFHQHG